MPATPALCALLDRHLSEYPAGVNGRLFVTRRGPGGKYRLTAGQPLTNVDYQRDFHTAHAGRRQGRAYRHAHEELVRALGPTLRRVRPIPAAFADTMGDTMYLLRHSDLETLRSAIALVQRT